MKLTKGFRPNLKCRNFQFKEGETYSESKAKLCESGFHACIKPTDTFEYYNPVDSIYHEVEMDPISETSSENTKVCSKEITVGRRMSVESLILAEMEYAVNNHKHIDEGINLGSKGINHLFVRVRNADGEAYSGNNSVSVAEYTGSRAISGNQSITKAGDFGVAISRFNSISKAGYHGIALTEDNGKSITNNFGISISDFYGSCLTGNNGIAIADRYAKAGKNSIVIIRSMALAIISAGINSVIMFMSSEGPVSWKIDGETYKPDTWYRINVEGERYFLEEAIGLDKAKAEAYFEGE